MTKNQFWRGSIFFRFFFFTRTDPFLDFVYPESVMQGQVEIRGARQGEEYVGWQMFLRGQKPADITAFIAVDDFR